jgi:hypothetical protein
MYRLLYVFCTLLIILVALRLANVITYTPHH